MLIENARIESTSLGGIKNNGGFGAELHIKGDHRGCIFTHGDFVLDTRAEPLGHPVGTAYGLDYIIRVLVVLGVPRWEDLPGTYVRIESGGLGRPLTRIGHIIKDQWFDPEAHAEEWRKREQASDT